MACDLKVISIGLSFVSVLAALDMLGADVLAALAMVCGAGEGTGEGVGTGASTDVLAELAMLCTDVPATLEISGGSMHVFVVVAVQLSYSAVQTPPLLQKSAH